MSLGRFFRQVLFWAIPIVAMALLVITGFFYWLVATQTGTRWLLTTVAMQFDGESQGVRGSLWHGVALERLHLTLPDDLSLELEGAELRVDWTRLWHQRELRVQRVALEKIAVQMNAEPKPDDPSAGEFVMPSLPIKVRVDELYVGSVFFSERGQALPVDLSQLQLRAEATLMQQAAQLVLHQAHINYDDIELDLEGQAQVEPLAAPWQSRAQIQAKAASHQASSQLCLSQYLPARLAEVNKVTEAATLTAINEEPAIGLEAELTCGLNVSLQWEGSLEQAQLQAHAKGQGLSFQATTNLQLDQAFPLRDVSLDLSLPDKSGVVAQLDWSRDQDKPTVDFLTGSVQAKHFDVGAWIPDLEIPAVLSFESAYEVQLSAGSTQLESAHVTMQIGEESQWNHQALNGHVDLDIERLEAIAPAELWQMYYIKNSDVDLRLGQNTAQIKGAFGLKDNHLKVALNAPEVIQLWPSLKEIGATQLEAELVGSLSEHQLTAKAWHELKGEADQKLGSGPVQAELGIKGVWDRNAETPHWQGEVQTLQASHAGLMAQILDTARVGVQLPSPHQSLGLDVGAFNVQLDLDRQTLLQVHHQKTVVGTLGMRTQGQTAVIRISEERIKNVMSLLNLEEKEARHGGVVDTRAQSAPQVEDLQVQLEWDFALKEALSGRVRLHRVAGDVVVPAGPPFALELVKTEVLITLTPQGGSGRSVLQADMDLQTRNKGYVKATGSTPIYYSSANGLSVRNEDKKELTINAHMDDLAWTSLFLQDQLVLGGELDANLRIQSTPRGGVNSTGTIEGKHLKVVRLDDGVRLLDGTLKATLDNNRFQLDRLYFPAILRVEPKEWRTATWVSENPDAKGGGLTVTGHWDLDQSTGNFDVDLYRYPILQRADRYAMVSGELHLKATLPHIALNGKLVADAGWFDLDMLGGIPTVDSDVVVIRSTDPVKTTDEKDAVPLDITMDLEVGLGPRFYLTGYGVNSGLVGSLRIQMLNDQITALGALNTRGGAIEVYGQRLQLRRGSITFQGDIANPILDIQALRTGLTVQAGVKVGGTARRPKIHLISIPEVSELEKLSWLLFGHGPDDGGDIALLLSVGTSFLTDGEPFYKRFGIDELSMRVGELGGAGSILPASSVASSPETEVSEVERRFIEASKTLSNGIKLSIRQALADTGTVGRASYRISRRLTAEISLGTISGLALVYQWFSRD